MECIKVIPGGLYDFYDHSYEKKLFGTALKIIFDTGMLSQLELKTLKSPFHKAQIGF